MTSIFDENGQAVPCTVIEAGPCYVTHIKTKERDGYDAVQLGYDEKKDRLATKPLRGHFAKAKVKVRRLLHEFKNFNGQPMKPGEQVRLDRVRILRVCSKACEWPGEWDFRASRFGI